MTRHGRRCRLETARRARSPVGSRPGRRARSGRSECGLLRRIRREVDRRDPAIAFRRKIAGRAAETATDLEHVHSGLYARSFRMLTGCCDAPAVQLVERPQIAMAGPLGIHSGSAERIVNPLQYRAISVIALNYRFDVGHARLPESS